MKEHSDILFSVTESNCVDRTSAQGVALIATGGIWFQFVELFKVLFVLMFLFRNCIEGSAYARAEGVVDMPRGCNDQNDSFAVDNPGLLVTFGDFTLHEIQTGLCVSMCKPA